MKADGLIGHIGLSNVSADHLRTAMRITDIAAVTVHYNVAVRLGRRSARSPRRTGIVLLHWHPAAVPNGPEGAPFHAVIDPIAAEHDVTPQQGRARLAASPHHQLRSRSPAPPASSTSMRPRRREHPASPRPKSTPSPLSRPRKSEADKADAQRPHPNEGAHDAEQPPFPGLR